MPFLSASNFDFPAYQGKNYLEIRKIINNKCLAIKGQKLSIREVIEDTISIDNQRSVSMRIYYPQTSEDSSPAIFLIHGGAWVAGSLDTHDPLARYFAHKTQSVVFSVDYPLSPEAKFPQALEDCYQALTYITDHKQEYRISSKLALAGDSAGGNLVASLSQWMKDHKSSIRVDLQVLINPAMDLTCKDTLEYQQDEYDFLRWQARSYLSNSKEPYSPYVSPLYSDSLQNLPPTLILVAEEDLLREDAEHYAKKLEEAGVQVQLYCQLETNHLAGQAAQATDEAKETLDMACSMLKSTFHQ